MSSTFLLISETVHGQIHIYFREISRHIKPCNQLADNPFDLLSLGNSEQNLC